MACARAVLHRAHAHEPQGTIVLWAPAAFGAFLSLTGMFLPAAEPAFLSFLPMCRVIVAMLQVSLWRRLGVFERRGGGA